MGETEKAKQAMIACEELLGSLGDVLAPGEKLLLKALRNHARKELAEADTDARLEREARDE